MNIGDFLHSRSWRKLQNIIYSWGASIVLIGALGKLEHWPMASELLIIGMSIEALIFFISAGEPLLDTPDWKRIYPQLRENDDPDQNKIFYAKSDKDYPNFFGSGSGGGGGSVSIKDLSADQVQKLNESFKKLSDAANGISDISKATIATKEFVTNLENAAQSIESVVNTNLKVSSTIDQNTHAIAESYKSAAEKIRLSSDQASVGIVQSSDFISNAIKSTGDSLKISAEKASAGIVQSVGDLSASLKQTGENIKISGDKASVGISQSVAELSVSVKVTADGLKSTGEKFNSDIKESSKVFSDNLQKSSLELNDSYRKVADSLSGGFKGLEKSSLKYVESIDKLNKNLGALNTAYELNLKGAGKVEEVVKDYSNSVGEIGKLLHSSVEETRKFNESTKEINENIQALNKVYGRMLGALNNKK